MGVAMSKSRKKFEDKMMKIEKKEVDCPDWFAFLPDDILLNILKRLPDIFLHYKAKFVCGRWFDIITNRILLDHASFIHQIENFTRHVDISKEGQGLKVQNMALDLPYSGRIGSWYNEFLLVTPSGSAPYVLNLLTKEIIFLPTPCRQHTSDKCKMAICFDRLKGVYKVVHLCYPRIDCHILDLITAAGSSRCVTSWWRNIKVPLYNVDIYTDDDPVSVQVQGSYFHLDIHCSNYLLSVDMLKEKAFQTRLPECNHKRMYYSIFEMGGFPTLIDGVSWAKADVWILKDFQRMKWDKLRSITLPDHYLSRYPGLSFQYPACGVTSKRYFIFKKSKRDTCMFSYDLKDGVVQRLNIDLGYCGRFVVHSSAPV